MTPEEKIRSACSALGLSEYAIYWIYTKAGKPYNFRIVFPNGIVFGGATVRGVIRAMRHALCGKEAL